MGDGKTGASLPLRRRRGLSSLCLYGLSGIPEVSLEYSDACHMGGRGAKVPEVRKIDPNYEVSSSRAAQHDHDGSTGKRFPPVRPPVSPGPRPRSVASVTPGIATGSALVMHRRHTAGLFERPSPPAPQRGPPCRDGIGVSRGCNGPIRTTSSYHRRRRAIRNNPDRARAPGDDTGTRSSGPTHARRSPKTGDDEQLASGASVLPEFMTRPRRKLADGRLRSGPRWAGLEGAQRGFGGAARLGPRCNNT